jgi:type II secretory pathway pseudopilin PulG
LKSGASTTFNLQPSTFNLAAAFTLIEVLVVVTLLSLIVVALMGVFTATQKAFRASVTQTDVLEGGRAAMDLITGDFKVMAPSQGYSNGAVNFNVTVAGSIPLYQTLTASSQSRTNVLESFFILSRQNQTWTGTGYVVNTNSTTPINPLYRFSTNMNVAAGSPAALFNSFSNTVAIDLAANNFSGMSHLLDGVVTLRVRAFDTNGVWINSAWNAANANNIAVLASAWGETGLNMFSNTLPPVVEIEMDTLEDRTLQRAESRTGILRTQYLAAQAGNLHVFRQRVSIPNSDPAAYQ